MSDLGKHEVNEDGQYRMRMPPDMRQGAQAGKTPEEEEVDVPPDYVVINDTAVRGDTQYGSVICTSRAMGYKTAGPLRRFIPDEELERRCFDGTSVVSATWHNLHRAVQRCSRSKPSVVRELRAFSEQAPDDLMKVGGEIYHTPASSAENPILKQLSQICIDAGVVQDVDAGRIALSGFVRDVCGYANAAEKRRMLEDKGWEFQQHEFDFNDGGRQKAYSLTLWQSLYLLQEVDTTDSAVDEISTALKKLAATAGVNPAPLHTGQQPPATPDQIADRVVKKISESKPLRKNADGEQFVYARYVDDAAHLRSLAMSRIRPEAVKAARPEGSLSKKEESKLWSNVTDEAYDLVREIYKIDIEVHEQYEGFASTIAAAEDLHTREDPVLLYVIDCFERIRLHHSKRQGSVT